MDERQWLTCEDWQPMLAHLSGRLSQRKASLYLCAGLRSLRDLLYHDASRRAVEAVERGADGLIAWQEVEGHKWSAEVPTFGYDFDAPLIRKSCAPYRKQRPSVQCLIDMGVYTEEDLYTNGLLGRDDVRQRLLNAANIAYYILRPLEDGQFDCHLMELLSDQDKWPRGGLVREVFGNPFRPISINPTWLTWNDGLVTRLAQAAYDERQLPSGTLDPARLAVLADAMEEAGCDEPAVLEHLRSPGPHYRGCHLLDAILAKE